MGDENLISSKRASELSGYAQDYIGQLARKGLIQGKRIAGLWYVSLDSLNAYKSDAVTYTSRPPQAAPLVADAESIISFDGQDYVSTSRAARITGYHPDYVGQLARSGKVLSRQIGNRWYVDRDQIIAHKNEKDALLGAVQSESVGIHVSKEQKMAYHHSPEPFFKYRSETRDLLPKPNNDQKLMHRGLYEEYEAESQPIAIHRVHDKHETFDTSERDEYAEPRARIKSRTRGRNAPVSRTLIILACAIGILSIGAIGIIINKDAALAYFGTPQHSFADANTFPMNILEGITDFIENIFGDEVVYSRDS